jgi:hypothetical protein
MFTLEQLFDLDNEHNAVDNFHDCVVLATDISHTPESLQEIFEQLPPEIQGIAFCWGLSDTVFRDFAYDYLRENA